MGIFSFLSYVTNVSGYARSVSIPTERKIKADWERVKLLTDTGSPSQIRQALIIADKTLDAALRDLVAGETMGERMKNARSLFDRSVYSRMWEAHKVRNNMVHEADYDPPYHVVLESINAIKKSLMELRINV